MSQKESVFCYAYDNDKKKLICELGHYIVDNMSTVRKTAKHFGLSKSTVHKNLTVALKEIDFQLFEETKSILEKNKKERHIRGGMATKMKYLNSRNDLKKSEECIEG
ncbi:MAG: stage III sporulation protein D [Ruminococcaceae bacterium]|nr:stage III sporulation protein D [Oscillospiraceae bacterium]